MGEVKTVVRVTQLVRGSVRVQPYMNRLPSRLFASRLLSSFPSVLLIILYWGNTGGTTIDSWGQRAPGRRRSHVGSEFKEAPPVWGGAHRAASG